MRKLFLTGLMLTACAIASAQNVQENEAIIFDYTIYYSESYILPEYTKDGKSLMAIGINNGEYDSHEYEEKMLIYNDNLEQIYEFKFELEARESYTIIKEREAVEDLQGNITYTGDWTEKRSNESFSYSRSSLWIRFSDYTGNLPSCAMGATQTLFNDDEDYEYLTDIYAVQPQSRTEKDRDGDGEADYVEEVFKSAMVGFAIKSSNGQTIQTINFGNGYIYDYEDPIDLIKFNDKTYLRMPARDGNDDDYYYIYYPVTKNSTDIKPIGSPIKIKVSPRIADRSESFTIELDETESNINRDIVVVNSAGQTVWKQNVPAGQNKVNISASNLNKGVNIIRVNGTKKPESCKVIVK